MRRRNWRAEAAFSEALCFIRGPLDAQKIIDRFCKGDNGVAACRIGRILYCELKRKLDGPYGYGDETSLGMEALNRVFEADVCGASSLACRYFYKALDEGISEAHYHLAYFYHSLYTGCLRGKKKSESFGIDFERCQFPIARSCAEEYLEEARRHWKLAIDALEPMALFDQFESDFYPNCDFAPYDLMRYTSEDQELMLQDAARFGYPPAIYILGRRLKETNPEESDRMIESVCWHYKVRESIREDARFDGEELERKRREELLTYPPSDDDRDQLSDYYNEEELELNTRGDGFD